MTRFGHDQINILGHDRTRVKKKAGVRRECIELIKALFPTVTAKKSQSFPRLNKKRISST